jgi:hypothetical protein
LVHDTSFLAYLCKMPRTIQLPDLESQTRLNLTRWTEILAADGVKAIDVAWLEHTRPEIQADPVVLTRAPEICIEILSPSNTQAKIDEKRALYFDAGATEVWICKQEPPKAAVLLL